MSGEQSIEKYKKMEKARLPTGAILNAMRRDNIKYRNKSIEVPSEEDAQSKLLKEIMDSLQPSAAPPQAPAAAAAHAPSAASKLSAAPPQAPEAAATHAEAPTPPPAAQAASSAAPPAAAQAASSTAAPPPTPAAHADASVTHSAAPAASSAAPPPAAPKIRTAPSSAAPVRDQKTMKEIALDFAKGQEERHNKLVKFIEDRLQETHSTFEDTIKEQKLKKTEKKDDKKSKLSIEIKDYRKKEADNEINGAVKLFRKYESLYSILRELLRKYRNNELLKLFIHPGVLRQILKDPNVELQKFSKEDKEKLKDAFEDIFNCEDTNKEKVDWKKVYKCISEKIEIFNEKLTFYIQEFSKESKKDDKLKEKPRDDSKKDEKPREDKPKETKEEPPKLSMQEQLLRGILGGSGGFNFSPIAIGSVSLGGSGASGGGRRRRYYDDEDEDYYDEEERPRRPRRQSIRDRLERSRDEEESRRSSYKQTAGKPVPYRDRNNNILYTGVKEIDDALNYFVAAWVSYNISIQGHYVAPNGAVFSTVGTRQHPIPEYVCFSEMIYYYYDIYHNKRKYDFLKTNYELPDRKYNMIPSPVVSFGKDFHSRLFSRIQQAEKLDTSTPVIIEGLVNFINDRTETIEKNHVAFVSYTNEFSTSIKKTIESHTPEMVSNLLSRVLSIPNLQYKTVRLSPKQLGLHGSENYSDEHHVTSTPEEEPSTPDEEQEEDVPASSSLQDEEQEEDVPVSSSFPGSRSRSLQSSRSRSMPFGHVKKSSSARRKVKGARQKVSKAQKTRRHKKTK